MERVNFARFTLAKMRPTAVTNRKESDRLNIINATGHADERMIIKYSAVVRLNALKRLSRKQVEIIVQKNKRLTSLNL